MRIVAIFFLFLVGGVTSDYHQHHHKNLWNSTDAAKKTIILNLIGNVYPAGHYYAEVLVGQPPKSYLLDPDTGSSLTWLQCDAPCIKCIKARHPFYKPTKDIVPPNHPMCAPLHLGSVYHLDDENADRCLYHIEYGDGLESRGYRLWDQFSFKIIGGATLSPRLVLGCGNDQKEPHPFSEPIDGMLGLGRGKVGILAQLSSQGLISNVIGHCFSSKKTGGGYLFLGDNAYDPKKLSWTPLSKDVTPYYITKPAEITFDGKSVGLKDLVVIFDSGVTYTYLLDMPYDVVLKSINMELFRQGNPLILDPEDHTLPVCWKGKKPFRDISEVKQYFKTLALSYSNGKTRFEITLERYLIISDKGNVCLGILHAREIGLPSNVVGDISMQGKMIVYDNEKGAIGWMDADCDLSPKTH